MLKTIVAILTLWWINETPDSKTLWDSDLKQNISQKDLKASAVFLSKLFE